MQKIGSRKMQKSRFQAKNNASSKQFVCTASSNPSTEEPIALVCREISKPKANAKIVSAFRSQPRKQVVRASNPTRLNATQKKSCDRDCRRKIPDANIDTKDVFQDVLNQNIPSPNDPNAAIGPDRIIAVVNGATSIIDKNDNNTIVRYSDVEFWDFVPTTPVNSLAGDPLVLYDEFSERFFMSVWTTTGLFNDAILTIESPDELQGEYPGSAGINFPAPWNLQGIEIVAANPIDADTPLVNADEVAGKIVLVASDDFETGSSTKGQNVADAGGVGMIIYNTEGDFLYSIFGGPLPSITVGQEIGEAILAQLAVGVPVIAGMRTLRPEEIGVGGFSQQLLAVSKTSSPNSRDDFYFYEIGDETGPFFQLLGDYPKLGINGKALYLTTVDDIYPSNAEGINDRAYSITAIEKAPLLDGTGVNILYFNSAPQAVANFFPIPTYSHAPAVSNEEEVTYFVSPIIDNVPIFDGSGEVTGHSFRIAVLRDVLSDPVLESYEIEVEPFRSTWADIPDRVWNLVKQPTGVLSEFDMRLEALNVPIVMYRAIQRGDSLYFAVHTGDETLEVRWYEIDISKIYDANEPSLKLKQEGKIALNNVSAFYPSIDVDVDGNLGIGFTISGTDQPVSLAHTGRLKNDPLGTLRSPFPVHLSAQRELPYYEGLADFLEPNILGSRWDDYTSVQVDPVGGKTFWYFAEYSNQNLEDYLNFETQRRTALITFSVEEGCGEIETRPKLLPQPIRRSNPNPSPSPLALKKNLKLAQTDVQLPDREFFLERIRQYIRTITASGATPTRKLLRIRF